MGHVQASLHIDASLGTVWNLATDPRRFLEWETRALEVRDVSGPLDRPGARYTVVYRLGGRVLQRDWEIVHAEPPNRIEQRSSGGLDTFSVRLTPSAAGTELTYVFDYRLPGGLLGEIVDKLLVGRQIKRDFARDYQNLKSLCEGSVPDKSPTPH